MGLRKLVSTKLYFLAELGQDHNFLGWGGGGGPVALGYSAREDEELYLSLSRWNPTSKPIQASVLNFRGFFQTLTRFLEFHQIISKSAIMPRLRRTSTVKTFLTLLSATRSGARIQPWICLIFFFNLTSILEKPEAFLRCDILFQPAFNAESTNIHRLWTLPKKPGIGLWNLEKFERGRIWSAPQLVSRAMLIACQMRRYSELEEE